MGAYFCSFQHVQHLIQISQSTHSHLILVCEVLKKMDSRIIHRLGPSFLQTIKDFTPMSSELNSCYIYFKDLLMPVHLRAAATPVLPPNKVNHPMPMQMPLVNVQYPPPRHSAPTTSTAVALLHTYAAQGHSGAGNEEPFQRENARLDNAFKAREYLSIIQMLNSGDSPEFDCLQRLLKLLKATFPLDPGPGDEKPLGPGGYITILVKVACESFPTITPTEGGNE